MHIEWKSSKKNSFCSLGGIFYMRNITLFWLPSYCTQALNLCFVYREEVRMACVRTFCLHPAWWTCVRLSTWTGMQSHAFHPGIHEHMLMLFITDLQASKCDAVHVRRCTNPQPHPTLSSSKQWEKTLFILRRNHVSGTLNILWWFCCF